MNQLPAITRELWLSVQRLAKDNDVTERCVYSKIYSGKLRHSRVGRSLRVRQCDWDEHHEAHVVEPGEYRPDPERQQAAVDRIAARTEEGE